MSNFLSSIYTGTVNLYPSEQEFIDRFVMGPSFPWFWQGRQTFEDPEFYNKHLPEWLRPLLVHCNGPFLSHRLLRTPDIPEQGHQDRPANDYSIHYEFFIEIFHRFMKSQGLQYSKIFRANLNLNWFNGIDHTEPHVDHSWPHSNFIMYLNTCDAGQTLIWPNDFSATYMIPCQQNTAVTFEQQWHAHRYPSPGSRRVVFVVTYI